MSQADFNFDEFSGDSAVPVNDEVIVETKKVVVYRKQPVNVYSLLLIISFILMLIATILLFMEVGRFDK